MGITKDLLAWLPTQVVTKGNVVTSSIIDVSAGLDIGILMSYATFRAGNTWDLVPEIIIWTSAKDTGDDYWFPLFRHLTQGGAAASKLISGARTAGDSAFNVTVNFSNSLHNHSAGFVYDVATGNHEFVNIAQGTGGAASLTLIDGLAYDHAGNTPIYIPDCVNRVPVDLVVDGAKRIKCTVRNPDGATAGDFWFDISIISGKASDA